MTMDRGTLPTPVPGDEAVPALSLQQNFSWMLVGNLVYRACQWGVMVALAKVGTLEMLGLFALGIAITAPITVFTNMNLRTVQATDARDEYSFREYLSLRLISLPVALLATAAFALLSGYDTTAALAILLIGVAKAIESVSDILFGLFQQRERLDRVSISLMLKGPITLLALTCGVALTQSILWGAAAMAGAYLLLLVAYDIPVAARLQRDRAADAPRRPLLPSVAKLAWLALPLAVVVCLISLNVNIPRYFVKRHLGEASLGVFAAISYLMLVGDQVATALGQAAVPRMAKHLAMGERAAFTRLVLRLLGVAGLVGAAGVAVAALIGRPLLVLLYRPDFAEHGAVLTWLMAASGLLLVSNVFGTAVTAMRAFRIQMPLHALFVTTMALLCLALVPRWHMVGAAGAVFCNCLLMCVVYGAIMILKLRQMPNAPAHGKASAEVPNAS